MKVACFLAILATLNAVQSIYVNLPAQKQAGQGWSNGAADNGPGQNAQINLNAAPGQLAAAKPSFAYSQGWDINSYNGIPSLDWPAQWPRAQVNNQIKKEDKNAWDLASNGYNAAGANTYGDSSLVNKNTAGYNGNAASGPYDALFDAAYNGALINLGIPAYYNPVFDNSDGAGIPDSYNLKAQYKAANDELNKIAAKKAADEAARIAAQQAAQLAAQQAAEKAAQEAAARLAAQKAAQEAAALLAAQQAAQIAAQQAAQKAAQDAAAQQAAQQNGWTVVSSPAQLSSSAIINVGDRKY